MVSFKDDLKKVNLVKLSVGLFFVVLWLAIFMATMTSIARFDLEPIFYAIAIIFNLQLNISLGRLMHNTMLESFEQR